MQPQPLNSDASTKPATAARIYDWLLGGVHNFPADQAAGRDIVRQYSDARAAMRANRAFLGRAVRELARQGVDQFLDLGSGIPTEGNVHEIAQSVNSAARVVYVDIDPVAVSEGMELLESNQHAAAIRADMRDTEAILTHPQVTKLVDFRRPAALLLVSVLHFVPVDAEAYGLVQRLVEALAPGSFVVISHSAAETRASSETMDHLLDIYQQRTSTPSGWRSREQVTRFFTGLDLLEPGVVWTPLWRPDPDQDPTDRVVVDPARSGLWCAVAMKH